MVISAPEKRGKWDGERLGSPPLETWTRTEGCRFDARRHNLRARGCERGTIPHVASLIAPGSPPPLRWPQDAESTSTAHEARGDHPRPEAPSWKMRRFSEGKRERRPPSSFASAPAP